MDDEKHSDQDNDNQTPDPALQLFLTLKENHNRLRKYDFLMTIASSIGFLFIGMAMGIHATKYIDVDVKCQPETNPLTQTEKGNSNNASNYSSQYPRL